MTSFTELLGGPTRDLAMTPPTRAPAGEKPPFPVPPVIVEPPLVDEDEEIYCPICNYNLSGIFSGRCPECGSLFDRNALIAAQQANAITLIPWDDPEPMAYRRRLLRTLRICLLDAERFAFAFSVQPRKSNAGVFFLWITLATTVLTTLSVLAYAAAVRLSRDPFSGLPDNTAMALAALLFAPSNLILTTLISSLYLGASCPHYDGNRHFRPWLNISAYASAHYLLTFPLVPVCFFVALTLGRSGKDEFFFVAFFIWMGCVALCVLTMRAVVDMRTSDWAAVRAAAVVLALIHGGTTLVCAVLSLPAGAHLASLF